MTVRVAPADQSEGTFEESRASHAPRGARDQRLAQTEIVDSAFPGSHWGLTPHESQVLVLLASGLNSRAIAKVLLAGETDVRARLRAIFSKLGVTSKSQAVACASADASFAASPRDMPLAAGGAGTGTLLGHRR